MGLGRIHVTVLVLRFRLQCAILIIFSVIDSIVFVRPEAHIVLKGLSVSRNVLALAKVRE